MAFIEEVYKNGSTWYGAHTGKEYSAAETEEKGCCRWSKPSYHAPDSVMLEIESAEQPAPSGNGYGKNC